MSDCSIIGIIFWIECFFSILGKQGLTHRVDRSKASLRAFLLQYLEMSRPV